ncbi:MAG: hypothetical protein ACFS24_00845 [Candidatus Karelsulcia muelleri]
MIIKKISPSLGLGLIKTLLAKSISKFLNVPITPIELNYYE